MTTTDWFIAAIRVLVVISTAAGARRAWKARRAAGFKTSVVGTIVTSIVMLIYLTGAVLLISGYGIYAYPRHLLWFVIGAVAYLWGGLWVVGKVAGVFETRASL